MALSNYPESLRCPSRIRVIPADRRALGTGDRPREARAVQMDRLWMEEVEFPPFNESESEVFRDWWTDDLILGGAYFLATWPGPAGSVPLQRHFMSTPQWSYIPGGFWKVTATIEVRGAYA